MLAPPPLDHANFVALDQGNRCAALPARPPWSLNRGHWWGWGCSGLNRRHRWGRGYSGAPLQLFVWCLHVWCCSVIITVIIVNPLDPRRHLWRHLGSKSGGGVEGIPLPISNWTVCDCVSPLLSSRTRKMPSRTETQVLYFTQLIH